MTARIYGYEHWRAAQRGRAPRPTKTTVVALGSFLPPLPPSGGKPA